MREEPTTLLMCGATEATPAAKKSLVDAAKLADEQLRLGARPSKDRRQTSLGLLTQRDCTDVLMKHGVLVRVWPPRVVHAVYIAHMSSDAASTDHEKGIVITVTGVDTHTPHFSESWAQAASFACLRMRHAVTALSTFEATVTWSRRVSHLLVRVVGSSGFKKLRLGGVGLHVAWEFSPRGDAQFLHARDEPRANMQREARAGLLGNILVLVGRACILVHVEATRITRLARDKRTARRPEEREAWYWGEPIQFNSATLKPAIDTLEAALVSDKFWKDPAVETWLGGYDAGFQPTSTLRTDFVNAWRARLRKITGMWPSCHIAPTRRLDAHRVGGVLLIVQMLERLRGKLVWRANGTRVTELVVVNSVLTAAAVWASCLCASKPCFG